MAWCGRPPILSLPWQLKRPLSETEFGNFSSCRKQSLHSVQYCVFYMEDAYETVGGCGVVWYGMSYEVMYF